jgi:hypothetical protein
MPGIAWFGIGCGTILIICVLVASLFVGWCKRKIDDFAKNPEKAAAEMVVKLNPDLEMLSTDDTKGEMTIRNKKGEVTTLSYKDISEGRITVRDKEGNLTMLGTGDLSQVPEWVPRLPNSSDEVGIMHSETTEQTTGMFSATTSDPLDKVEEFLKARATDLGLGESNRSSFSANGVESLTATYRGGKREITAIITRQPNEPLKVQMTYSEKK